MFDRGELTKLFLQLGSGFPDPRHTATLRGVDREPFVSQRCARTARRTAENVQYAHSIADVGSRRWEERLPGGELGRNPATGGGGEEEKGEQKAK